VDDGADTSADCATRLKVLADRTRLAVLQTLLHGPRCVSEISSALGVEQSLLSHHLRVLRDAALVEGLREGKHVLYRIAHPVAGADPERTIELGCCRLSFAAGPSPDPSQH
jgi:ArsR family transcriptional regulator